MNRKECIQALKIAKRHWSNQYKGMTIEEQEQVVGLWERSFPRESFDHVREALNELSFTMKKHPQIHEIRQVVWKNHGRPVDSNNLRRVYKLIAGEEWTEHTYDDLVALRST